MANMTHCKHRTYLTSTAIRVFVLLPDLPTRIAIFTDYIYNNTSSKSPVVTDQLSTNQIKEAVIFEKVTVPHYSKTHSDVLFNRNKQR
jgi:hypothetical protein